MSGNEQNLNEQQPRWLLICSAAFRAGLVRGAGEQREVLLACKGSPEFSERYLQTLPAEIRRRFGELPHSRHVIHAAAGNAQADNSADHLIGLLGLAEENLFILLRRIEALRNAGIRTSSDAHQSLSEQVAHVRAQMETIRERPRLSLELAAPDPEIQAPAAKPHQCGEGQAGGRQRLAGTLRKRLCEPSRHHGSCSPF